MINWTPKQIELAKREVAEHFQEKNQNMPTDFEMFFVATKFNDIDMLKRAVVAISEEKEYMSNLVQDICFTIETEYQSYYDLDENDWGLVASS
jgi:hypothetical protein